MRIIGIAVVAFLAACSPQNAEIRASRDSIATRPADSVVARPSTPALASPRAPAGCRETAARAHPHVQWAADTGVRADFNYDGSPDLALWGADRDSSFVLAIVECVSGIAGKVWSLPLDAAGLFGSADLEILSEDPTRGEGWFAENCMGMENDPECRRLARLEEVLAAAYERGGRGLSIGVPDRDRIHVYWDPDSTHFASWRP